MLYARCWLLIRSKVLCWCVLLVWPCPPADNVVENLATLPGCLLGEVLGSFDRTREGQVVLSKCNLEAYGRGVGTLARAGRTLVLASRCCARYGGVEARALSLASLRTLVSLGRCLETGRCIERGVVIPAYPSRQMTWEYCLMMKSEMAHASNVRTRPPTPGLSCISRSSWRIQAVSISIDCFPLHDRLCIFSAAIRPTSLETSKVSCSGIYGTAQEHIAER